MSDQKSRNEIVHTVIDKAVAKADSLPGLTLRSALAALPFVGSSLSVVVEARLSSRQAARIDALYDRLSKLESTNASTMHYSESLLEHATRNAMQRADDKMPRVFANILAINHSDDPDEVFRLFLLEVTSSLSRYELALLVRLAGDTYHPGASDMAQTLLSIHTHTPDLEDARAFALSRLSVYKLINSAASDAEVTPVGRKLIHLLLQ